MDPLPWCVHYLLLKGSCKLGLGVTLLIVVQVLLASPEMLQGDAFQVTATNQKMSRLGAVGMAPCSRHGGGILLGAKTQLGGLRQE